MHYVSVEGLTKAFGIKPLFKDVSFDIGEGDKIALVARNGSGKSTLLKILAGKETPDEGKLWIHKDVDVTLLEQEPSFAEELSILDNIFDHDHPVINAIKEYESANEENDPQKLNAAIKELLIKEHPEFKAIFDQYPAYSPLAYTPFSFTPPSPGDSRCPA